MEVTNVSYEEYYEESAKDKIDNKMIATQIKKLHTLKALLHFKHVLPTMNVSLRLKRFVMSFK